MERLHADNRTLVVYRWIVHCVCVSFHVQIAFGFDHGTWQFSSWSLYSSWEYRSSSWLKLLFSVRLVGAHLHQHIHTYTHYAHGMESRRLQKLCCLCLHTHRTGLRWRDSNEKWRRLSFRGCVTHTDLQSTLSALQVATKDPCKTTMLNVNIASLQVLALDVYCNGGVCASNDACCLCEFSLNGVVSISQHINPIYHSPKVEYRNIAFDM